MELWTDMHIKTLLPSMLIMAVVALILGKCLAKRSERVRMLPFQVFAVLLFVFHLCYIFLWLFFFSPYYFFCCCCCC